MSEAGIIESAEVRALLLSNRIEEIIMEHPGLKEFERNQMREEYPFFQPGDTIRVNTRVIEGEKERIQAFEGVVLKRSGGGLGESFTVRKISYGIGVERTFPLHSPRVESIKVIYRGRVRRAKLYYLRDRVGKKTRIKSRRKSLNENLLLANGRQDAAAGLEETAVVAEALENGEETLANAETAPDELEEKKDTIE